MAVNKPGFSGHERSPACTRESRFLLLDLQSKWSEFRRAQNEAKRLTRRAGGAYARSAILLQRPRPTKSPNWKSGRKNSQSADSNMHTMQQHPDAAS